MKKEEDCESNSELTSIVLILTIVSVIWISAISVALVVLDAITHK